eukprot:5858224-Alexandrium_andersonii.AAC.1
MILILPLAHVGVWAERSPAPPPLLWMRGCERKWRWKQLCPPARFVVTIGFSAQNDPDPPRTRPSAVAFE